MTNPLQSIPNLPPAIGLDGAEQLWINQAGVDRRTTVSSLNGVLAGELLPITGGVITGGLGVNGNVAVGGALSVNGGTTLGGVSTAVTPPSSDNSNNIATTAYVTHAIGALPPGVTSFNARTGAVTLNAADITGAGGALLDSPAFVNLPTAPTAAPGTSTGQLATTAFVETALSSAAVSSFNGRTGAVTFLPSDLPTPTPAALGGVLSLAPTAHNFLTGIGPTGAPIAAQPSFADISGTISSSQMPASGPGSGTVTSVGLLAPPQFIVGGSPVTGSGVLGLSLANQNANLVWAGPASGAPGPPTFRPLTAADIPGGLTIGPPTPTTWPWASPAPTP